MTEYIEREKVHRLVRSLNRYACNNSDKSNYRTTVDIDAVQFGIDKIPAADVVEVVKCKECKYFFDECCNHEKNRVLHRVPDFGKHYSYVGRIKVEPDHYCGHGERKGRC